MSETYKFVYFDLRGMGEPVRYILQYVQAQYEEVSVSHANFVDIKNHYKWRQLPEFHIDGKILLTQSCTISRYLAKRFDQFNLMPTDILEASRCDEIVDICQDIRLREKPFIISKFFAKDGKCDELKRELMESYLPTMLRNLDELISTTRTTEGDFILGNRLSWADFWLAHWTSWFAHSLAEPQLLKDFGALKKQQEATLSLPEIKRFIAIRPKTFEGL